MNAFVVSLSAGVLALVSAAVVSAPEVSADVSVSPKRAPRSLPAEFYLFTRECKQTFAEIGSAMEKPEVALVNSGPASDYTSACRASAEGTFQCISSLLDKNATFMSTGSNSVEDEYIQVTRETRFFVLQTLNGNVMFLNPSTNDAVLISRQYVDFTKASNFFAVAKICKALYLNKAEKDALLAQMRARRSSNE